MSAEEVAAPASSLGCFQRPYQRNNNQAGLPGSAARRVTRPTGGPSCEIHSLDLCCLGCPAATAPAPAGPVPRHWLAVTFIGGIAIPVRSLHHHSSQSSTQASPLGSQPALPEPNPGLLPQHVLGGHRLLGVLFIPLPVAPSLPRSTYLW